VSSESVLEILNSHRSIRHFHPEAVPEEDLMKAVQAGQRAATSSNAQAYSIIRIRNPDLREELARLSGN
jgi:FMN reductase (NADPH)